MRGAEAAAAPGGAGALTGVEEQPANSSRRAILSFFMSLRLNGLTQALLGQKHTFYWQGCQRLPKQLKQLDCAARGSTCEGFSKAFSYFVLRIDWSSSAVSIRGAIARKLRNFRFAVLGTCRGSRLTWRRTVSTFDYLIRITG
jgi:hypothetical protein